MVRSSVLVVAAFGAIAAVGAGCSSSTQNHRDGGAPAAGEAPATAPEGRAGTSGARPETATSAPLSAGKLDLSSPVLPTGVDGSQISMAVFGEGPCQGMGGTSGPLAQMLGNWQGQDQVDIRRHLPRHHSWLSNLFASFGGGSAEGSPFGGAPVCMVQQSTSAYTAGANLAFNDLAPGLYEIVVTIMDANSNILQYGEGTVTVQPNLMASVNIDMQPYQAAATSNTGGGVAVNILEPGGAGTEVGSADTASGPVAVPLESSDSLVFTSAALDIAAGTCGPVTLSAVDGDGNALLPTGVVNFTPSSTSSTGAFYADPSCQTAITSGTLATGQGSITIYYMDSTAGSPTLGVAVDPSLGWAATTGQVETITAASATPGVFSYLFMGSSFVQAANACGALTLSLVDSSGQATTTNLDTTFVLSSTASTGAFYTDSACQTSPITSVIMPANSSQVVFYYKDSADGSPSISAVDEAAANSSAAIQPVVISN